MKVESESEVAHSCLTLSGPMDYSLPGSSVHGISQARVLEWGAITFSDDYTVEVTNRFKRLNLLDRVPEELWMEIHNIAQEVVIKIIPKKKKCKKTKCLSEEALKITEKNRSERQSRKVKI